MSGVSLLARVNYLPSAPQHLRQLHHVVRDHNVLDSHLRDMARVIAIDVQKVTIETAQKKKKKKLLQKEL